MGGLEARRLTVSQSNSQDARLTFCSPARNGVSHSNGLCPSNAEGIQTRSIETALAIQTASARNGVSHSNSVARNAKHRNGVAIETAFANCFLSYNQQDCAKIYFIFGAILQNALDCAKMLQEQIFESDYFLQSSRVHIVH